MAWAMAPACTAAAEHGDKIMTQPLYGANASQIKRNRRVAEMLMSNSFDASPTNPYGAIARIAQGFVGGMKDKEADKLQEQQNQTIAQLLGAEGTTPDQLEAAGVQYENPMLVGMAGNRRQAANQAADDQWRQQRAATQDSQWAQSHAADENYRQQMLAQRGQQDIPSGYRQAQGGALEAIPGGPADPNKPMPARALRPTTDQANAAGFYDRIRNSNDILNDPSVTNAAMSFGQNVMNQAPMGLGNYMTSPEYQKYDQASRDFVNAVLRKESGAAISESEFQNARIQYFPQPGDTPDKIAQKAKNRQIVIEAMKRTAGPALGGGMATGGQPPADNMEFGEVGQIPEGAVVEDDQGMRYRKENGTLVPVQ